MVKQKPPGFGGSSPSFACIPLHIPLENLFICARIVRLHNRPMNLFKRYSGFSFPLTPFLL